MDVPRIRPGLTAESRPPVRFLAHFPNSAPGNLAIQQLLMLGVPADGLAVTEPTGIEGGQGMLLAIAGVAGELDRRAEATCTRLGARIVRSSQPPQEGRIP